MNENQCRIVYRPSWEFPWWVMVGSPECWMFRCKTCCRAKRNASDRGLAILEVECPDTQ